MTVLEQGECKHNWTGYIPTGLNSDQTKRWYSRKCQLCGELDGEWRKI